MVAVTSQLRRVHGVSDITQRKSGRKAAAIHTHSVAVMVDKPMNSHSFAILPVLYEPFRSRPITLAPVHQHERVRCQSRKEARAAKSLHQNPAAVTGAAPAPTRTNARQEIPFKSRGHRTLALQTRIGSLASPHFFPPCVVRQVMVSAGRNGSHS